MAIFICVSLVSGGLNKVLILKVAKIYLKLSIKTELNFPYLPEGKLPDFIRAKFPFFINSIIFRFNANKYIEKIISTLREVYITLARCFTE
jgi:hypothetical protein